MGVVVAVVGGVEGVEGVEGEVGVLPAGVEAGGAAPPVVNPAGSETPF